MVNLIMDPLKSYFNPLEHILSGSEIDNGLENLFSFESMGIKTCDKELVSFDKHQIDKFQEGISLKDGFYHVKLPCYPEKNSKVPSNHFIALTVLDRTMEHLNRKGLVIKYEEVFDKQLEDGIIDEINVSPSSYDDYTWIPHRPVIRTDEQVTTKIRPVFNCSLKTNKELPSLNPQAPDVVYKPPLVYCRMEFINISPFPVLHLSRNAAKVSESLKISDQRMAKLY